MVALDRDARNAGVAQTAQAAHRLVERQRIDRPLVKEVSGQNHKINRPLDVLVERKLAPAAKSLKRSLWPYCI